VETLIYGLKITVLGLATVFVGLLILILIVNLISRFVNGNSFKNSRLGEKKTVQMVEVETADTNPQYMDTKPQDVLENDELICVITAAVAASLDRSTHNLVVRSIRRVDNISPIWNRTGRQEQIWTKL